MRQEVRVTITFDVDVTKTKEDIARFVERMLDSGISDEDSNSFEYYSMSIQEEKDIYKNE